MITKDFDLDDIFLFSEMIDKMGIEADIDSITKTIKTSKLNGKKDASALGKEIVVGLAIDIITKIIRNLYKAKKEVKQFISNMTGLTEKEVSKFGIKQMKEFFTELSQHEGFDDFLSQVGE